MVKTQFLLVNCVILTVSSHVIHDSIDSYFWPLINNVSTVIDGLKSGQIKVNLSSDCLSSLELFSNGLQNQQFWALKSKFLTMTMIAITDYDCYH